MSQKLAFLASDADVARDAHARLVQMYGSVDLDQADIIVALGGDGFMLQTLHATQHLDAPVYGMNRGTVGFLMNAYEEDGFCLLYTSPSPRDATLSRMPSSA